MLFLTALAFGEGRPSPIATAENPGKSADFLSERLYKPQRTAYISRPVTRRGGLREPGYAATQRFWAAGGFVGFGAEVWHRRPAIWIVARSLARALRREGLDL